MPLYDFECPIHGLLEDIWLKSGQFAHELPHNVLTSDANCGSMCSWRPSGVSMQPDEFWSGKYMSQTDSYYTRKSSFREDLKRRNFQIKEPGMDADAESHRKSNETVRKALLRQDIEKKVMSGEFEAKMKQAEKRIDYEIANGQQK